jgi:hypothetical protein
LSEINQNEERDRFAGLESMLNGNVRPIKRSTASSGILLEKAPNQIIFIESEKFLNGPKLFPLQYAICRDFFELLCPHCNDIDRINLDDDVPREQQVLFEYDICPICGLRKEDIADELHHYNELVGVMGMRSGKGVLTACMSAAIVHELLGTEELQKRLGLVKKQIIEAAFIATSAKQSTETVYGHFRGFYDGSPWFQELRKRLMDLEISDENLRRGSLYKDNESSIYFKHKKIIIQALHSNSGSLAGRTRIFSVIDELSRFDSGGSKQSATEVYRVMKRSLLTIKTAVARLRQQNVYDIPDARMFCISSPIFLEDKMMQLLKQAETQDKMFAFRRATWEANPTITREDLADEFAADPVGAERDYSARPPGAENPLIPDPKIVDVCIDQDRQSIFNLRERHFERIIQGVKFNYITVDVLDVQWKNLFDYVIHCDPGRSNDSFCLAIGHLEDGKTIIDGAIEARPIPRGNRMGLSKHDVHFPSMTKLILDLNRTLSLKAVTYDRWNSIEQIDQLRDNKILTVGKNLDRDDHVKFVESLRSRVVRFPKREAENMNPKLDRNIPCAKALYELIRLEDDGKKVDHPSGGSSDMVQCYVGVHRLLVTPHKVIDMKEIIKERRKERTGLPFNRKGGRVVHLNRFV